MRSVHTITQSKSTEYDEFDGLMATFRQLTPEVEGAVLPSTSANLIQEPLVSGLSNESPNAHVGNNPLSGSNIDLTPYQDSIPENWHESHYQPSQDLISSIELGNFNNFTPEEEESIVTEKGDMEQDEEQQQEDHLAKAEAHLEKAESISANNVVEVANAIDVINTQTMQTVEETKQLVKAAELNWISNIGENIQQLTSMATGLGNACVTFVATTTKVTVFIFNN